MPEVGYQTLRNVPQPNRPAWYSRSPKATAEINWSFACWTYANPFLGALANIGIGVAPAALALAMPFPAFSKPIVPILFVTAGIVCYVRIAVVMRRFARTIQPPD